MLGCYVIACQIPARFDGPRRCDRSDPRTGAMTAGTRRRSRSRKTSSMRNFERPRRSAGLRARGGDEVAVRRRADGQAPPDARHLALELPRFPEALDDVELAAVREATPGDLAGRAHEVAGVAEPRVVDEEHPALRLQRAADELPERLEVPARHVRVPEAEEADVEVARRLPLEDVGEDVVGRAAGPGAVQLEHLGDGVD